ncbi:response regulator transcription factor [Virgibacillus halodenitrificans]|uniref:response regulator n=1 Tax=Virgibacillus halodenitrificans TaxID=1482 RepID=UPI0024BFF14A|nr:response regulator transcription factor [Virgibacillus halodenitrificans]WHX26551.1 response regulator transcription factor [Virgibacillus halodenitrificans]
MKQLTILIVDDMEAHRRRLARIIGELPHLSIVGEAQSGKEAVALAVEEEPDIILMDIEMEDKMAGIRAASEINFSSPESKIIILTIHKDNDSIFSAYQTNIADYVIKSASKEEIIEAIENAASNTSPIRPFVASKLREEFARVKKFEENFTHIFQVIATLTPSEVEILKSLCQGLTRKQIAAERSVELETIKKQISSILKKFDKRNTKEVIRIINDHDLFTMINKIQF